MLPTIYLYYSGFHNNFWLGGGGEKSIGASTKRGNVRGLGVFTQILGGAKLNPGGGKSQVPPPLCETLLLKRN